MMEKAITSAIDPLCDVIEQATPAEAVAGLDPIRTLRIDAKQGAHDGPRL